MNETLYTVGHSTHPTRTFVDLLRGAGITAVSDVRSSPYSRFNPQFNRETLQRDLRAAGIAYVWLGVELGARREEPGCRDADGNVRYDLAARTPAFAAGIERLREGMREHRVALMCAERDPLHCHRNLLVCRALRESVRIRHLRADGTVETHEALERRLLAARGLPDRDLFADREAMIRRAYDLRGSKTAPRNDESA